MTQDGNDAKEGSAQAVPPEAYLLKTKRCKFYLQGICSKGAACGFAHTKSELKTRPDFYKTRMCPKLRETGQCPDGAECRYAHTRNDLRRLSPVRKASGQRHENFPCKIKLHGTEDSAGEDFAKVSRDLKNPQAKLYQKLSEAVVSIHTHLAAPKPKADICTQTDLTDFLEENCQNTGRVTLSLASLQLPEEGKSASNFRSRSAINCAGTQKVNRPAVTEARETDTCTDTQKVNQNPKTLKLQFAKVSKLRSSAPLFQPGALPPFTQVAADTVDQLQSDASMCCPSSNYEHWVGGKLQGWQDVVTGGELQCWQDVTSDEDPVVHCDDAGGDDCRELRFDSHPPTTDSACQALIEQPVSPESWDVAVHCDDVGSDDSNELQPDSHPSTTDSVCQAKSGSTSQSERPNKQQKEEFAFEKAAADLTHWLIQKKVNVEGSLSPPSTTVCDENSSLEDHNGSNATSGTGHNSPGNKETDNNLTLHECVAAHAPLAHCMDDLELKAKLQSLWQEPDQCLIFEDCLISV